MRRPNRYVAVWMAACALLTLGGCANQSAPLVADSMIHTRATGSAVTPSPLLVALREAGQPPVAPDWLARNDARSGPRLPRPTPGYGHAVLIDIQRSHFGRPHNTLRYRRHSVDQHF